MEKESPVTEDVDMDKGPPPENRNDERLKQIVKWKNRGRMAWTSVCANIILVLLVLFTVPNDKLKIVLPLIETFTLANVAVVFAYMGTTTLPWINIFKGK